MAKIQNGIGFDCRICYTSFVLTDKMVCIEITMWQFNDRCIQAFRHDIYVFFLTISFKKEFFDSFAGGVEPFIPISHRYYSSGHGKRFRF